MNLRLIRVCELIKRELGTMINLLLQEDQQCVVSVRAVDITPDLKKAHIFVTVFGDSGKKSSIMHFLHNNRKNLQKKLSQRIVLKYTPYLYFKLDDSIERGVRVLQLLDNLPITEEETKIQD